MGQSQGTSDHGADDERVQPQVEEVPPPPEPEPVEQLRLVGPQAAGRADWEAAAATVLRKARRLGEDEPAERVWELLGTTTLDGIAVPPLGTPDDTGGGRLAARPARAGAWDVRSALDLATVGNDEVLHELERGAASLWLTVGEGDDLAGALEGVLLDLAPVVLQSRDGSDRSEELLGLLSAADQAPHPHTNLGCDPLAARLRGSDGELDRVVTAARAAQAAGVRGIVVDATAVHDLGASDAQELGWSMAVGAAYLRLLTEAGLSVTEAAGQLEFRYAATAEQFATIAKLRAARRLWARILELSGADGAEQLQLQHAVTSRPMMSRYDPYVNMLRTTVAAFAAGVGGADAVTVLPFDTPLGVPEAFGRRIARNTSALLISESHVAAVTDPAGGAFAVERLTDGLAEAGWSELGRIEETGGAAAALDDGSLQARIAEVAERRRAEVARRVRPITGLTEFPNLAETLPERQPPPDGTPAVAGYGADFEALRDDPVARPVFLATMGSVAAHTARATFASNLFAAGGVPVAVAGATSGVEDVVAAYADEPVVCLAGADAAYAEWGADLIAALRAAGAKHVILAGKPGSRTVDADLVDDHCALGVDALDFLTTTRRVLS